MSKPKKRKRSDPAPAYDFFPPQPSPEGVAKVRALYRERAGKEITDEQAKDVLYRVMRWQYLNFVINTSEPRSNATRAGCTGEGCGDSPRSVERGHEAITGKP